MRVERNSFGGGDVQKVMLPVSKEELLNALAQLSEQELETLIKELEKTVAKRIVKKIDWLADNFEVMNPQPLKAQFQGMYKLIVGD